MVHGRTARLGAAAAGLKRTAAALCVLLAIVGAADALAGPAKRWRTLPRWLVQTVRLRGYEIGAERLGPALPARDRWTYVRGSLGLYQLRDLDGNYRLVRNVPRNCTWAPIFDRREPSTFLCAEQGSIAVLTSVGLQRRTLRPIFAPVAGNPHFRQYPLVTATALLANRNIAFSYGYAQIVGLITPRGGERVVHVPGFHVIRALVPRSSAELFVADDWCHIGRLVNLRLVERWDGRCRGEALVVPANDGSVWIGYRGLHRLERFGRDGSRRSYELRGAVRQLAVAPRTNAAYALTVRPVRKGAQKTDLAIVPWHGRMMQYEVPFGEPGPLAVDARGRVWLTVPQIHAFALLTPPR